MKFAIITHVAHIKRTGRLHAYSPYVREMNLWIKNASQVAIVAPLIDADPNAIHLPYEHDNCKILEVPVFDVKSASSKLKILFMLPKILLTIFKAMKEADHIHLRCPGNIGLLGCIVQIVFPGKPKTAKYAGNWDPESKQPLSYRLQRWILSSTLLTKNMKVLVYGQWGGQSKNILPFFTATYHESDKINNISRQLDGPIQLLFVGTLARGKRPLYAIQLGEELIKKGFEIILRLYGEGEERQDLENYIALKHLGHAVFLMGNKTKEEVQDAYKESHFLILASESEGWPKAVAEAMFWGCIPAVSRVSCVPDMLGEGARGILLDMKLPSDAERMHALISNEPSYRLMSKKAADWSRIYTIDHFENEIQKLLA
ncbi:MAG TPA: glycosyltransferase family 4 protein [Flavobacterium sp.]|nr:glycosyltransferase family 4 protein [Flavobacterium sp.]